MGNRAAGHLEQCIVRMGRFLVDNPFLGKRIAADPNDPFFQLTSQFATDGDLMGKSDTGSIADFAFKGKGSQEVEHALHGEQGGLQVRVVIAARVEQFGMSHQRWVTVTITGVAGELDEIDLLFVFQRLLLVFQIL